VDTPNKLYIYIEKVVDVGHMVPSKHGQSSLFLDVFVYNGQTLLEEWATEKVIHNNDPFVGLAYSVNVPSLANAKIQFNLRSGDGRFFSSATESNLDVLSSSNKQSFTKTLTPVGRGTVAYKLTAVPTNWPNHVYHGLNMELLDSTGLVDKDISFFVHTGVDDVLVATRHLDDIDSYHVDVPWTAIFRQMKLAFTATDRESGESIGTHTLVIPNPNEDLGWDASGKSFTGSLNTDSGALSFRLWLGPKDHAASK
jgi:hypothetical protein